MNPLIFVILIIMILFTAYHFWTDIRNAWNTGETFAEGMTSGADPKNNVQYNCPSSLGGAGTSYNTYDATTLTPAQKAQVVATYGDEAKKANRGAAYYACKQGCEDLNNGTCQAQTTPSSMAQFKDDGPPSGYNYTGESQCQDWDNNYVVCKTPLDGTNCGIKATTIDECAAECNKRDSCGEFYFKEDVCFLANGKCVPKSNPTNPQPHYKKTGNTGAGITEFDNWRKKHLGSQVDMAVSSSKPYGSVVSNWDECKNVLNTNPQAKQVVYNKSSKACYPMSEMSPEDQDGKGGTNSGWISAQKTSVITNACALEYCNAEQDLKTAFCGGSNCTTDAQAKTCIQHWFNHGQNENRQKNPVTCSADSAPQYKGTWEDQPTALWTPASGDWKYVPAGPPKTDTDASFDKCKSLCAEKKECKGFEWNVTQDDNCALLTNFSKTGGEGSRRFRLKNGVPDPQYQGKFKSGVKVVDLQYGDIIQLNNMYMPKVKNDFGFLYFINEGGYKTTTTTVGSHAGTNWKIMGLGGENDVGKPVMKGHTVLLINGANNYYLAQNENKVFCGDGMRGTLKETPDNTCQFTIQEPGAGSNIKTNSKIALRSKNNNQYLISCNWENTANLELRIGTRNASDPTGGVWQIIPVDAKGFTTAYSNISDNSAPGGIVLDQGLNNAYASGTQIMPGENTVVTTDAQGNTITTTTSQSSSVDPTTGAKTEKKCISVSELSSAAAWVDKLFGTLSNTKCADKNKVEAAKTASKMDFISGVIKGYQNDRDGSNKYYMDAISKATPHLNQAFSGNNMAQGTGGMFGSGVNGNSNNLAQGTTESISNNTAQTQAPVTNNIQAPQPPTWQAQQMAQQASQTINGQVLPNGFIVQPGNGKCPNGCKYPQYDNKGCEDTILNGKSYRKCPWVKDGLNGGDCAECGAILMPKNKFGYARTRPGLFDNISINMAIENAGASKKGDYYNIGKKFMNQLSQIKNFNLPDTINTNEYVSIGKMVHKYQTEETNSSKNLLTEFINQLLTTSNMSANGKVQNNSLISEHVNKTGGNFDIDQKRLTLKGAYAYDEGKKEVADDNRLGGSSNMYEKQISEKIRRLNGIPRDPKKRPNPYDSVWDIFKY